MLTFVGVDVTAGRRDAVVWADKHRAYADTGIWSDEGEAQSLDSRKKR